MITSTDLSDFTLSQLNAVNRCDALVTDGPVSPTVIDCARRDAVRFDIVPDPLCPGLTVVMWASA